MSREMTTANYIIFLLMILFAMLFIAQSDTSLTLDELLEVKTSVEESINYYIAQSDASQTVDGMPNAKTIVKNP